MFISEEAKKRAIQAVSLAGKEGRLIAGCFIDRKKTKEGCYIGCAMGQIAHANGISDFNHYRYQSEEAFGVVRYTDCGAVIRVNNTLLYEGKPQRTVAARVMRELRKIPVIAAAA